MMMLDTMSHSGMITRMKQRTFYSVPRLHYAGTVCMNFQLSLLPVGHVLRFRRSSQSNLPANVFPDRGVLSRSFSRLHRRFFVRDLDGRAQDPARGR